MTKKILFIFVAFFLLSAVAVFAANPSITVGTVSGSRGSSVDLPIQFTAGSIGVGTVQFDLTIPSSITYVSVSAGSAATAAGKDVQANAITSTQIRVIIFGLNQNSIGSGQLAVVRFNISPSATVGTQSVVIGGIVAANVNDASPISTTGANGSIIISSGSTPTPTPTPSLSADLNSDNHVNSVDFGILLSNWNSTSRPKADINQDGTVNSVDFGIMLSQWTG